ncbi:unnamed protein product [Leuciscus chuanchicus]
MLITAHAKLVTYTGVVEGFSTYCRACPGCGLMYRYQEWRDGIHNFNDHMLITLHLCIVLRTSVQTHHSVSGAIEVLEQTENKTFPKKATILHAYMHFEAMTSHNYLFSCYKCGYYPPVVVMDLHRKGVFNMPVSEMEAPPAHFDGTVDTKQFWDSVMSEIICSGLLACGRKNPFVVAPSYTNWAPWIGPKTRKADTVCNTEHEKFHAPRQATEMADLQMTEERLQDALINLKVDMVRNLCKQCGLDSKGSKMDLILRLRDEMKNRSSYDKIFEKVWGASGGWAVVMCPCAVVYSIKFNLRAESPRDYADILLSWKHFPNIAIYDFARGLATHTNLREPETLPFRPHEGRLAEVTTDNLHLAGEGKLKVSLPWLKTKKTDTDANCHPITGTSDHYTLYDVFHERNTKDARDSLRRIGLVPELAGWVNSQCAEQLFSDMRKNNYFLNTLTPSEHIFMTRNILHHHNTKCNDKTKASIQKVVGKDVQLKLDHNVTQEQIPPDDMEVTPPESDVMEITPTPDIYASAVMRNIQLACEWVEESQHHFTGKMDLPKILRMKMDDALVAITMRDLFENSMRYDDEAYEEEIWAPFLFIFQRIEDMEVFLQELRDSSGRHLHAGPRKTGPIGFVASSRSISNIFKELVEAQDAPCKYLLTYKLSQDHLELFFSAVRARGGYNSNNPTARQFKAAYKRLLVRHQVKNGTGNRLIRDGTNMLAVTVGPASRQFDVTPVLPLDSDHDYSISPYVDSISEFKDAAIHYIAGYVVKKMKEKFLCMPCSVTLSSDPVCMLSLP